MVARLGRMVMAPSATSSCCSNGLTLEPHVSEPTHRKCPTWSALLAAARICLQKRTVCSRLSFISTYDCLVKNGAWQLQNECISVTNRTQKFHGTSCHDLSSKDRTLLFNSPSILRMKSHWFHWSFIPTSCVSLWRTEPLSTIKMSG